tara:strand:- start:501 stop:707 length:207 start_codon:yes stop_codon:yes gene_type:complete
MTKWRVAEMCGRKVLVLDDKHRLFAMNCLCADCEQPATQVICELTDDYGTADPEEGVWFYCGVCQVGG